MTSAQLAPGRPRGQLSYVRTLSPPSHPMTNLSRARRGVATVVAIVLVLVVAGAVVVGALFATGTLRLPGVGGHGAPPTYNLSFTASGLPTATQWSVDLAGSIESSTKASIWFARSDGSYGFTVAGPSGCIDWTPDPASGTAVVSGSDRVVEVVFSGACQPSLALSMGTPSWSGATTDYGSIVVTGVSAGLNTSLFGFTVSTGTGALVPVATAAPTTTCKAGVSFSTTACSGPTTGDWYVVLYYTGNSSVADVWVNGAWTTGLPTEYPVTITADSLSLMVISPSSVSLPGSGDTLNAYGLGTQGVSGSSGSF